ncbi:macrophage colony-stimulating factor 1 isoform X2 [Sorex fumeus]|uniref:macrophage colony-stimulating factor 1 isoform X2 n=1 Tax=Sorex fumeus TaxID=62283 RepID=UPI0024AE2859|nr:macrophage colony-stimulating factor 1 isoform X2 [Sorex fumeus]
MTARGAAGRCPPTTWLGPWLLLAGLLVSRSVTEEVPESCSHMIGNGHLQNLQKLIDSQMETSCQITFEFVDQEQLKDPVCYLKKAFLLVQDILEDTMRFKDNTPNANVIMQLQELSLNLKSCFTKDYEEQDKACVRTFNETPLQLLEKIKNVFNETKYLLKNDWNVFSKNCNKSFAKCSSQDVVTKPDCNCLYPKATPNSGPASALPLQPLAPSKAPLASLSRAGSRGTEDSSLLPVEQPLHTTDPGSAKQRPPRSTCQSFETLESPSVEGGPTRSSPQPGPGLEDVLNSVLDTNWELEEASGETSEDPDPRQAELSSSRPAGGSAQAGTASAINSLREVSPLPGSTKSQQQADAPSTVMPGVGSLRPTSLAPKHTPQKTDGSLALPRDRRDSAGTPTLTPPGLSSPSTLSSQPHLSGSPALSLGELEGKRSTRDRRSPTELEGARAGAGGVWPPAHFNSVPLTDAGRGSQPAGLSDPQLSSFVFRLLVPGVILVLLAVGGLLFYRWKRRRGLSLSLTPQWVSSLCPQNHHWQPQTEESPMEPPEGSPLTQDADRQVEAPV